MIFWRIHQRGLHTGEGKAVGFILLIFIVFAVFFNPAQAAVTDPFSEESGKEWVPLEAYLPQAEPEPPAPLAPKSAESSPVAAPVSAPVPAHKDKRAMAHPAREINLPVMPGLASAPASSVTVSSTEQVLDLAPTEKKEWTGIQEAHHELQKQTEAQQTVASKAYRIRLPSLPSSTIQSIPASPVSQGKLQREAQAAKAARAAQEAAKPLSTVEAKKQTQQETAACEAYSEYRRRQLVAIASDRDTLSQLKSVLADLGLVSKLSFMTNSDSALSAEVKTP